jgi:hypothetical protein
MSYLLRVLCAAALLGTVCPFAPGADDKDKSKGPLSLSLEAVTKTVKKGTVPKFRLTIRNDGTAPEKILDIRGRPDLQDNYYDLEVLQDGKVVRLARAISDPGPIAPGDRDFVTLKPGQKVTFPLERFATAYQRLPPGKYKARVKFWPPFEHSKKQHSPEAEFTVVK